MIDSEKSLEDYICNNQENFINTLKQIYGEDCDIKFVGRQIKIGVHNIADLMYFYDDVYIENEITYKKRIYIIVELKYRKLEPKDLSQLQRYMNCLKLKLNSNDLFSKFGNEVYGTFVSFGENEEMKEILIADNINDISYISICNNINYKVDYCSYNESYINEIELDDKIKKLYEGE